MKIAQIVCAWPPGAGGIGQSAYRLNELLNQKYEIVNFNPKTVKPWLKYGHGAFLPQILWRLSKFDYIYLHYPFFGTAEIVWLYKLIFSRPKLILHYHMDVQQRNIFTKILSLPSILIRQQLLKQADIIVTSSLDYVKNSQIKKYYQKRPDKFKEIPFAVDLNKFKVKDLNQISSNKLIAKTKKIIHYINDKFIKRHRLNLLFVAALDKAHYFKGLNVLIEALADLKQYHWQLEIVGDGDQKKFYQKLSNELGLGKQIKFRGQISDEDLIRAYQESDLLILPSINNNEAFGIVLIEALACGVPVIASNLPGVRKVFNNYQEGLLVDVANKTDLSKKIEFIFNNEKLRKSMAIAARQLAHKKYGLNLMKKKLERLFLDSDSPSKSKA